MQIGVPRNDGGGTEVGHRGEQNAHLAHRKEYIFPSERSPPLFNTAIIFDPGEHELGLRGESEFRIQCGTDMRYRSLTATPIRFAKRDGDNFGSHRPRKRE